MHTKSLCVSILIFAAAVLSSVAGCAPIVPTATATQFLPTATATPLPTAIVEKANLEDVPVYPGAINSRPFDYPMVGAVEDSIVGATKTASRTVALSNVTPDQIQAFYNEKLLQSGWKQQLVSKLPNGSASEWVFERGQQLLLIMYFSDGNDGFLIIDLYQISA